MTSVSDPKLFLALPVEKEARDILQNFIEKARKKFPDVHWCVPSGLHLTLHFFGYTKPAQIPLIHHAAAEAAAAASKIRLRFQGGGFFPGPGNPRVIWAGVQGDLKALFSLQKTLGQKLLEAGFEIDERPYQPHVTLGRVRHKNQLPSPEDLTFPESPEQLTSVVALYESKRSPKGSLYEILETFDLS